MNKSRSNYHNPDKAVLVATSRSGSTFLLNCLDSHPQIYSDRAEPLDPNGHWQQSFCDIPREKLLKFLWSKPGYKVCMFKLSYKHTNWVGLPLLREEKPRILHLHRADPIRTGISAAINTLSTKGILSHPTHSFTTTKTPSQVTIDPETFIPMCHDYLAKVKAMRTSLKTLGLPLLFLTYRELIGASDLVEATEIERGAETKICDFLGVTHRPLISYTKRVNPFPLGEIVKNWDELKERLSEDVKLREFL